MARLWFVVIVSQSFQEREQYRLDFARAYPVEADLSMVIRTIPAGELGACKAHSGRAIVRLSGATDSSGNGCHSGENWFAPSQDRYIVMSVW